MVSVQLISPISPFISDWLYRNLSESIRDEAIRLNTPLKHESVHLTDLTLADEKLIDLNLERRMDYARRISSVVLSLRKSQK